MARTALLVSWPYPIVPDSAFVGGRLWSVNNVEYRLKNENTTYQLITMNGYNM